MRYLIFCLALLLCQPVLAISCLSVLLQSAQSALVVQDGAQAVSLLQPFESQCAGLPDYDYAYGRGLLNSGNPEMASWVLERVTAVNPRHGAAWLDLADAYARMDDLQRAREALQHALLLNPPAAARDKITQLQQYLQSRSTPWHLSGYISAELGFDSNVNTATDLSSIAIPALGGVKFRLDPASTRQASPYNDIGLGMALTWQQSAATEWYWLPSFKTRKYLDLRQYDHAIIGPQSGVANQLDPDHKYQGLHQYNRNIFDLQSGVAHKLDDSEWLAGLQIEQQQLADHPYLTVQGGSGEWRASLGALGQLRITGQVLANRYQNRFQRSNDTNQILAGMALNHRFCVGRGQWDLAVYRMDDQAIGRSVDGDERSLVLNGDVSFQLWPHTSASVSVSHEADDYQRVNPVFMDTRSERLWNYTASLIQTIADAYTITLSYTLSRDDANIPVYGYRRQIASLNVRRDF